MKKKIKQKKSSKKEEPKRRTSGILLHLTSLPSSYGVGDLGDGAYRFADFLAETKQGVWQILPLNPTAPILGNSPYNSFSVFAGNQLLVNPDFLVRDGYLTKSDIDNHPVFANDRVDYENAGHYKNKILRIAYEKTKGILEKNKNFQDFCSDNSYWLEDYTLFIAAKEHFNGIIWNDWPAELRDRTKTALKEWKEKLRDRIVMEKFFQFLFFSQWAALKTYCNGKKIKIMGDIPIYVTYDSSDVWANPQMFKLDKTRRPAFGAGVPPDYFSTTGQLWGNPVYNWNALKKTAYVWWIIRFKQNLKLFDLVRVDHFRGFVAYWEVPAGEATAVNGKWIKVPAKDFFTKLLKCYPSLPIIAEDLGHITDDVKEIMRHFKFPGMKLLLFAFDDTPAKNPYIPHNQIKNCVVYTGTHDNNTVRGWFEKEARQEDRNRVLRYLGREIPSQDIAWEMTRLAMMSVADTIILPMQDVLGLGEEARMNKPATTNNNWQWRLTPEMLSPWITARLREITEIYGRA